MTMKRWFSLQGENFWKGDLLMVVGIALLGRVASFFLVSHISFPDTETYLKAGADLWQTGQIQSPVVMPLYPLLLYGLGKKAMTLLGIGVSAITCLWVYLILLRGTQNRWVALGGGIFLAFYPLHLYYSSVLLTESLFIFFLYGSLWAFYEDRQIWGSFLMGMSLLLRPSFFYLAPFLVGVYGRVTHEKSWRETGKGVALYLGVVGVLFAPWLWHNFLKYGQVVWLNCGDGVIACWENHKNFWTQGGAVPSVPAHLNFIEANQFLKQKALQFVWENPLEYFSLCWDRFQRFWSCVPLSHYKIYVGSQAVLGGMALAGGFSFLILKGRHYLGFVLPLALMILFLSTLHCLTHALDRYRLPLDPALIILASLWGCGILRKGKNFYKEKRKRKNHEYIFISLNERDHPHV